MRAILLRTVLVQIAPLADPRNSVRFFDRITNRPAVALAAVLATVAVGARALVGLEPSVDPGLGRPAIGITVRYSGALPGDVEREVVRPIERRVAGVHGAVRTEEAPVISRIDPATNATGKPGGALARSGLTVLGAGTVALVLLLGVGSSWRSALIVSMAAAVSVAGTLEVVAIAGLELTPVTLLGLALGLTFVLDDAVTVREAIVRQTEIGADDGSAASRGAMTVVRGISLAAVAAIGVFGPASTIGGSAGRWFAGIALVVVCAVGVSAVVASILVPALSVSVGFSPHGKAVLGAWSRRVGMWFETLADRYHELLAWALDHRRGVTAITVALAAALAASIVTGVVRAVDPSSIDLELRGPDAHTLFGVAQRVADEVHEIDGVSAPVVSTTAGSDGESLARIDHVDGGRVVRLQAAVHRRRLRDVVTDVDATLSALPLPPGYDARYSGEIADRNFTLRRFARALGIGLALVAALLAIRFRTVLAPAAILAAVSTAWAGGYLALLLTGSRLDVPALMAGAFVTVLVVRFGVQLLAAYRDRRAHDPNDRVSLIEAGRVRLRPTFISAVAMAGALLPLGLVSGAHRSLAIALVGGVIGASVAVLVVTPTTYALLKDVALVLATRFRAALALGKRRIRSLPRTDDEGVMGS